MGVFDQAEKLEQGKSPKTTGNVFDQAQQLDGAPKWGNALAEPSASTDVGPIAPPSAPPAPWQRGTGQGSIDVEADTSLPTEAGIAATKAADVLAPAYSDFYTGVYKQIGKKGYGATKLANRLVRVAAGPDLSNKFVPPMPSEQTVASAVGARPDFLTPTNTAQKVGGATEDIGEFLLPAGEIAKGAEATKAALGGGRLARLAGLGVRAAGEGAVSGVQELAKTGGDFDKATSTGLTQAGTSAVLGGVGAAASKLGGRTLANLLRTTQSDFRYGRNPVEAVGNSGIVANSMSDLRAKLATELGETGRVIGDLLDLSPNAQTFDRAKAAQLIQDSVAEHADRLERFGGDGSSVRRMGTSLSQEAANSATLRELHELKTEIGKQVGWAGESQIENARQEALKEMYGKLNSFIDANAPGVKDVQAHYGGILTAGKAVDKEIARRAGAKFNLPFFSVAGLGLGLETGHPAVGSIGLMTRAANAGLKQPAVVTRLAKLGDPAYAAMSRAGARYLLSRFGIRPFVEDNSEGSPESRDSYAGQK